jgi:hypothetical protein
MLLLALSQKSIRIRSTQCASPLEITNHNRKAWRSDLIKIAKLSLWTSGLFPLRELIAITGPPLHGR